MPIKRCKLGKVRGFKYGDRGKCYHSKNKAVKQGQAIEISRHRKSKDLQSPMNYDPDVDWHN